MRASRALRLLTVLAALALTSCGEIGLPQQGFATRYLGGSIGPALGSQLDTATNFAGQPLSNSPAGRPARPRDVCEATAQDRAQDISAEGFDEDLQKKVYDAVIADCRVWSKRR